MARVRIQWNQQEFDALTRPSGLVGQGIKRAAGKTRDRARRNLTSPSAVDSGRLRQSMEATQTNVSSRGVTYEVGSRLPYAIYQEEGTKGHGPRRAKVMVFKPKGSNSFVFARWVRGIKARKFLQRALKTLSARDFY